MLKQTICIESPVRLSLRHRQLVITDRDDTLIATRPVEDIGVLMIQNQQAHATIPLLTCLAAANVAVILCDSHAMPSAMLMPLDANTTQAETFRLQIAATEPQKKQLWRQIVTQKIRNQALLLDQQGHDGTILRPHYTNVLSGDTTNREGIAARIYWTTLFGRDFIRSRDGPPPNALLNYGYTILRAATARAILSSGLSPLLGLYHHNRNNPFPLADDLMEPFRPVVDSLVCHLWQQGHIFIDSKSRATLLGTLLCDVKVGGEHSPVTVALTTLTASMVKCLKGDTRQLTLPQYE